MDYMEAVLERVLNTIFCGREHFLRQIIFTNSLRYTENLNDKFIMCKILMYLEVLILVFPDDHKIRFSKSLKLILFLLKNPPDFLIISKNFPEVAT